MEKNPIIKFDENNTSLKIDVVNNEIKDSLIELLIALSLFQSQYLNLEEKERGVFFKEMRDTYNKDRDKMSNEQYAVVAIFLSKAAVNGEFKEDDKGNCISKRSRAKNPVICDVEGISEFCKKLHNYSDEQ